MAYNLSKFEDGLSELGIVLQPEQLQQFLDYYEMLVEKNKVMNLTSITEFDQVVEIHFLDSLSIVKAVDMNNRISILDLGTGAGLPGIPLKIAFPHLDILLMDSLNKRIVFLNEVIEKISLKGISAVHGRAEEMARKSEYREKFSLCVSRAVANLSSLSEYCLPFVKVNGEFVSYKAGQVDEEVEQAKRAVKILGGQIDDVIKFQLPGTVTSRSFVKLKKIKRTPKGYPRKAGTPGKSPIL
jgi:16S rRNA (guanine527-N7)-methyltransferase